MLVSPKSEISGGVVSTTSTVRTTCTAAFEGVLDAIRNPTLEDSLYLRLMLLGRQSDRMINLFDEHKDAGHYTVDQAVEELEVMVMGAAQSHQDKDPGAS